MRNYRAEMMALNAGHFAGLGVGHVPKYLTVWESRRVPKRPTGFCGATRWQSKSLDDFGKRREPYLCY